jgi:hypothetical protein
MVFRLNWHIVMGFESCWAFHEIQFSLMSRDEIGFGSCRSWWELKLNFRGKIVECSS